MLPTEISNFNSNSIFVLSIYGIKVKLLWLHFVENDTNDLVGGDPVRFSNKGQRENNELLKSCRYHTKIE